MQLYIAFLENESNRIAIKQIGTVKYLLYESLNQLVHLLYTNMWCCYTLKSKGKPQFFLIWIDQQDEVNLL